jgi:hypothetical protein
VVETGVAQGVTTAVILQAMTENGKGRPGTEPSTSGVGVMRKPS